MIRPGTSQHLLPPPGHEAGAIRLLGRWTASEEIHRLDIANNNAPADEAGESKEAPMTLRRAPAPAIRATSSE